jgi:hypothetical protein
MEKTVPELMAAISPDDWAQVPVSVLNLIEGLMRRMDRLEQEVGALRTENELLKGNCSYLAHPLRLRLPTLLKIVQQSSKISR